MPWRWKEERARQIRLGVRRPIPVAIYVARLQRWWRRLAPRLREARDRAGAAERYRANWERLKNERPGPWYL